MSQAKSWPSQVDRRSTRSSRLCIAAVSGFVAGKGLRAPVFLDTDGAFSRKFSIATLPGLLVIKDGQVVLNVAVRAVSDLELGNETIRFLARFSGVSHQVEVPVPAVMAIYAQENGQGMMFPAEGAPTSPPTEPEPEKPPPKKGPQLRVVK